MFGLLLALALPLAGAARAAELRDGTWVLGAGLGAASVFGGAKSVLALPYFASGSVLYVPRSEHSWAFEVDRLFFPSKNSTKGSGTVLALVSRNHLGGRSAETIPYVLLGVGYSELHLESPSRGSDRGSGAALALGGGLMKAKDGPLAWGSELRFIRAAAPLSRYGLGGVSLIALTARLTWRLNPSSDPFGR